MHTLACLLGPYFLGNEPSLVDAAVAPWLLRANVLQYWRGVDLLAGHTRLAIWLSMYRWVRSTCFERLDDYEEAQLLRLCIQMPFPPFALPLVIMPVLPRYCCTPTCLAWPALPEPGRSQAARPPLSTLLWILHLPGCCTLHDEARVENSSPTPMRLCPKLKPSKGSHASPT